ncbi:MAG: ATP-binding protein [Clostridiales bacterium]|nr:ATP-binding protein [Clostridiales bacterium]
MGKIFGNKARIDLGSSDFRRFIEYENLYIDKTIYIEHIIQEASSVLLITRPRRTGKSLNLDMLRTFLDCKLDTKSFFRGLYIESSEVFKNINKCPVIYLDIKDLNEKLYKKQFFDSLKTISSNYLQPEQMDWKVKECFENKLYEETSILRYLIENLHSICGVRPYVLIDEYDKILMDNIHSPLYEEIRQWLTNILESALKSNLSLEKAVITGVTRISKESMFSGLNNIEVFDVFTPSVFDGDFSLTEEEAHELLDKDQLKLAREWYNNYRVGNELLYTLFSALSYQKSGRLENYWGRSGTIDLLVSLLNKKLAGDLAEMIKDPQKSTSTSIDSRLSYKELLHKTTESGFYSLAVQAGYLSHTKQSGEGSNIYQVHIHNKEIANVWKEFILDRISRENVCELAKIFKYLSHTEEFSKRLKDFIDYQLSFYDLDKELEKTYHVLFFGLALGAGYCCHSNKESGLGRYDLLIEGDDFSVIIELKKATSKNKLEQLASKALAQIDTNEYVGSLCSEKPLYKVGVSCYKTSCYVKTSLHNY